MEVYPKIAGLSMTHLFFWVIPNGVFQVFGNIDMELEIQQEHLKIGEKQFVRACEAVSCGQPGLR